MSTQSPQWIATARLLRRTGFGTTGAKVDAVVGQDWSRYLDGLLDADPETDPGAVATPMPPLTPVPPYPSGDATKEAMDRWNRTVDDQMLWLADWWLSRMISVHEPIHEKLTWLWHNHFATSAAKVRFAVYMGAQNEKLRRMKLGDFREFAYAMLTDAAMLSWLDGKDNVAASPNENLSREFMELFALGHGSGYTEHDVREGARALSGWMTDDVGRSSVRPDRHDSADKTVLGVTGSLDAAAFCDAVLGHPASATHIVARLWQQLASDASPSSATLARLIDAYGPNRDLKALTKAILLDPEFVSGASIITPAEWLIGVIRTLSIPVDSPEVAYAIDGLLTGLGQRPFYPPDVSGWPRGRVWVSTASITTQAWAATELAKRGNLSTVESAPIADRVDAVGYFIGVGAWSDRSAAALKPYLGNPAALFTAAVNAPEYLTA
ncbi:MULTISPECIES: DUF1800 domain-containing protein [unclassified Mycobacterium]|uniref:DUF1800 domain-containing protein n=1 Tax=unclassified Mycobacterium TaxID=2642494 RepID=UPI0029C7E773|nr:MULTISPECIES: DUF1800 domain-containing protein [unclassified Mycobacterium]